jgi:hypothetical protein
MDGAWLLAGLSVVVAAGAWIAARRAAWQVRELTAMYWQLKHDHLELKARLDRAVPDPAAPPRMPAGTQFVPLASVKK